ncbi:hypothetical protein CBF34_01100 [Vagococcus penaei]|uniref:Uncharacterized protein n=1 Tax=Vagococcus penaei TaxID=633807 RepID=A0A1Q2D830_9ENTE|nr:flagellar hook-basal body complex protein [Vagococcus penaei]AQP54578.1 hypothetical protein BW732_10440 [Vagococcus penaei]RSU06710.1 hypothetical protein CBF34_01100 [Vagococcus penaei]
MIRSMDTLRNSLDILQKRQENISGNVANTNTPGYRAQGMTQRTKDAVPMFNFQGGPNLDEQNNIGNFVFGNELDLVYQKTEQGGIKQTQRKTDFSIVGDGFFNIQLDNGQTVYTRNGNFTVNEQNQLVTQQGFLVLGQNGQPIDATTINQAPPAFQLTRFNNPEAMQSVGQTLYVSGEDGMVDTQSVTSQNSLEGSNVNMVDQMTQLIEMARQFETNQKALHASDETLGYATTQIGRV